MPQARREETNRTGVVKKQQTGTFQARPDGNGVLPDYRSALNSIIIHPSLMRHSSMHAAMFAISNRGWHDGDDIAFESYLTRAIIRAFPNKKTTALSPLFDSDVASDDEGRLRAYVWSLYNSFPLRQKTQMRRAFKLMEEHTTSDLPSLLKLLGRASEQDDASKRRALHCLIRAVKDFLPTSLISDTDGSNAYSTVANAAARFIDDWKDKAFESAFLKPSMLYFYLAGEDKQDNNVELHGTSYHGALLEATTGIRVPRVPFWGDTEVKGVIDFQDAGLNEGLLAVHSPNNIEKTLEELMVTLPSTTYTQFRRVPEQQFIFNNVKGGNRMTPYAMSLRALDASAKSSTERMVYATYLNCFTSYFTEDVVLAPLVEHMTAGAATLAALQQIFMEFKVELATAGAPNSNTCSVETAAFSCDDVRSWIWDTDGSGRVLNKKAAKLLLAQCGVVKTVPDGITSMKATHRGEDLTCMKIAYTAVPITVA